MKRWFKMILLISFLASQYVFAATTDFVEGVKGEIEDVMTGVSKYFSKNLGFVASGGRVEPTASLPKGTIIPINLALSANVGLDYLGKISEVVESKDVFNEYYISKDTRLPFLGGPAIYGRAGMNFIPIEIGFKYQIPVSSPSFIEDKIGFSFKNKGYGIDLRLPFSRIGIVLASVSLAVGFAYNHMTGSMSIEKGSLVNSGTIGGEHGIFTINNLKLESEWTITNYNPYARLGVKLLIIRAYLELGYNINKGITTTTLTGEYTSTLGKNKTGPLNISQKIEETTYDPEIKIGANIPLFIIVGINIEGRRYLSSGNTGISFAFTFIF